MKTIYLDYILYIRLYHLHQEHVRCKQYSSQECGARITCYAIQRGAGRAVEETMSLLLLLSTQISQKLLDQSTWVFLH